MRIRVEKNSLGEVSIPANKLWGAQTQHSLENFKIGNGKITKMISAGLIITV